MLNVSGALGLIVTALCVSFRVRLAAITHNPLVRLSQGIALKGFVILFCRVSRSAYGTLTCPELRMSTSAWFRRTMHASRALLSSNPPFLAAAGAKAEFQKDHPGGVASFSIFPSSHPYHFLSTLQLVLPSFLRSATAITGRNFGNPRDTVSS